jgi:uncharacterized protein with ATP-grasp and redox domains
MKVGSRCGYCLIHRGYKIINMSTDNEEIRREAMHQLLQMVGKQYNEQAVPSIIGAERCRIIAKVTGCKDPYKDLRKQSNQRALELLPEMKQIIHATPKEQRLKIACLISCLGNVIDYDVPGNNSDLDDALNFFDDGFYIDDVDEFKKRIEEDSKVLFLTDNAGEIAFDTLVVNELKNLRCNVTVAVKGGPSLNDALMIDAEQVGMTELANEVITTGTDAIGIRLDESPDSFKTRFFSADLIIAKGMANWETMTETPAPCPMLFLLRTKCEPVANSVEAPEHQNIAFLVEKGWKL